MISRYRVQNSLVIYMLRYPSILRSLRASSYRMTPAKTPSTTRRYVSHKLRSPLLISPAASLQVLPRFGLKEGQSWEEVKKRVINLNTSSDRVPGVIYKLVFFGRHGEGFRESVFTTTTPTTRHDRHIFDRQQSAGEVRSLRGHRSNLSCVPY